MDHLLVSIGIRCGEWEFSNKYDIIPIPDDVTEESAIKKHYSEDACLVDGDTYYYDNECYAYTVHSWQRLNPEQRQKLEDLGIY